MPQTVRVASKFAWVVVGSLACGGGPSSVAQQETAPPPLVADDPDDAVVSTPDPVDDVHGLDRVWARLEDDRRTTTADTTVPAPDRIRSMIGLGMWPEAVEALTAQRPLRGDLLVVEAELRFKQHRYRESARRVAAVLARAPEHRDALLLLGKLQIQEWNLEAAARTAERLLVRNERDEDAALLMGTVRLQQKRYDDALDLAQQVQQWNSNNANAFALEAEVRFWAQDPDGAEGPLTRALAIDPYNADARFAYGYAIWRRVDATQLDDMAAQWELALSIDPLHYRTHWHWGNGHTNLTYADYVEPTDSVVRERLRRGDELIGANRIDEAVALTREVEAEFPESVLPSMMRGSAFYMAYDMPRGPRLDSAEATFRRILESKDHYGPAHNGLAAVIKQQQFEQLRAFDSLETSIATSWVQPDSSFEAIFPDATYYPGDRMQKMVHLQLGPSQAYLPMLARFDRQFAIPPLHRDLAEAMGRPFFRTSTTFDNRQWMDIRGVGSGATGIEYVERGAHLERNVLLHEYTHLVHGRVFSDEESRRVRALYYAAMENARTLDYYASNNESEFLAQAYPAFLSPVKVHALNHKAFNTRSDLEAKDPDTFDFVASLIRRQEAYLDGDSTALKSNWAQTFVALSEENRDGESLLQAEALLDTALMWDDRYLPAFLSYGGLLRDAKRFDEASQWLQRALVIDSTYAPIYAAYADLVGSRALAGDIEIGESLQLRVGYYGRALELETDYAVRARLNGTLRSLYRDHGHYPQAIRVSEEYMVSGPTVSTYLRDRRDEAARFAGSLRSAAGYATETLPFFTGLVNQKPQHYGLRGEYADALAGAGRFDEAVATLEEAQRILRAAGRPNRDYMIQMAEYHLATGDSGAATEALALTQEARMRFVSGNNRLARVLARLGDSAAVQAWLGDPSDDGRLPAPEADVHYTNGWIAEAAGDLAQAEASYRAAVELNPYRGEMRLRLIAVLVSQRRQSDARRAKAAAANLELPMGPDFQRRADDILSGR